MKYSPGQKNYHVIEERFDLYRQLQCLIAFELKWGLFKPEYLGKMNFYLSALGDLVRLPHESAPLVSSFSNRRKKK